MVGEALLQELFYCNCKSASVARFAAGDLLFVADQNGGSLDDIEMLSVVHERFDGYRSNCSRIEI